MVVKDVLETHRDLWDSTLEIEYFVCGGFDLLGLRVLEDVKDALYSSWTNSCAPHDPDDEG